MRDVGRCCRTVIAVAALLVSVCPALAGATWTEDFAAAREESKKTGKPILADFTGSDWCKICKAQHMQIYNSSQFAAWAGDSVILLKVDFPIKKEQSADLKQQNEALKDAFKVRGMPTTVFFDARGRELGRFAGYAPNTDPEKWVAEAQAIVSRLRRR